MCSAALALAGCGGQEQAETEVEGPRIERAIAHELAELSDEVADQLESGDSCGAAQSAAQLRERLTAAINEGKVPETYLEELSGATNELELAVPKCIDKAPPPPPDTGEDEDDDHGKKGKRKKKKKDKKDDGDDTTTESLPADTITIPEETTTEETTTEDTPTVPTTEDGR